MLATARLELRTSTEPAIQLSIQVPFSLVRGGGNRLSGGMGGKVHKWYKVNGQSKAMFILGLSPD